MKFYGKNEIVWDKEKGQALCKFENGEYETEDTRTIEILQELEYRSDDDGGQAENIDTEGQETEKEQTFAELRQEAKNRKIKNYIKMNKQELIEALKEGE